MVENNYSAWEISERDFPKNGDIAEEIKFFLRFGILAPSTHNTQPWKIKIANNTALILPDWSRRLPQADPDDSNLFFSLGCLAQNTIIAAAKFGYTVFPKIEIVTKQESSIQLVFKKTGTSNRSLAELFPALSQRYSNKLVYSKKLIDPDQLRCLREISADNTKVVLTTDDEIINRVSQIHQEAVAEYAQKKDFTVELSHWMRTNNTKADDGMPAFVVGQTGIPAMIGKHVIGRFPQIMKLLAKKDRRLIQSSSAVGIIASPDDHMRDWIYSGMTYEKLALQATVLGLSTTVMAAMTEDKFSKKALGEIFNVPRIPQMFFRLGFSSNVPYHTPRRNLEKALV